MPDTKVLCKGKYLNLMERDGWEYVSRNHHNVAIILPVLADNKTIVLIDEYRVPLGKRVIGLPAGLVGDHNSEEGLFDGARRELEEETGYLAESLELVLSESPSSCGMTDETFNLFIARKLRKTGEGGGDDSEDINIFEIHIDALKSQLKEWKNKGYVIDPKIYMGLWFLNEG